ncbi:MAG: hypothetical protein EXR11_06675 [Rhodospirillaceae bacterium]|nr:hypothetical protein [Rhodospirillaceae bacterium]
MRLCAFGAARWCRTQGYAAQCQLVRYGRPVQPQRIGERP